MLRYTQYLLEEAQKESASAAKSMEAIREPLLLVQGEYPNNIITPTRVSQTYLGLAELLKLPLLKSKYDTDNISIMYQVGFEHQSEIIGRFKSWKLLTFRRFQDF